MKDTFTPGRFQVVELQKATFPSICILCRQHAGDGIDPGTSTEFDGALLFCLDCVKEMGRLAGLVDKPSVEVKVEPIDYVLLMGQVADDIDRDIWKLGVVIDNLRKLLPGTEVPGEPADLVGKPTLSLVGSDETSGQDDDTTSDEGPISFPASTGDEPFPQV